MAAGVLDYHLHPAQLLHACPLLKPPTLAFSGMAIPLEKPPLTLHFHEAMGSVRSMVCPKSSLVVMQVSEARSLCLSVLLCKT